MVATPDSLGGLGFFCLGEGYGHSQDSDVIVEEVPWSDNVVIHLGGAKQPEFTLDGLVNGDPVGALKGLIRTQAELSCPAYNGTVILRRWAVTALYLTGERRISLTVLPLD